MSHHDKSHPFLDRILNLIEEETGEGISWSGLFKIIVAIAAFCLILFSVGCNIWICNVVDYKLRPEKYSSSYQDEQSMDSIASQEYEIIKEAE